MNPLNDCGCCQGVNAVTPTPIANRPGLAAIAYRVGTHASFKESLLARLSSTELSALSALSTRANDDFTIALCDGFATMADVLTFYQERIANELYLRTATERRSVLELARLIGYRLRPGVAASTYLAFTLEEARMAPGELPPPVKIEVGVRVQSVPGPDEAPQTFETIEDIEARATWNALRPQLAQRQSLVAGTRRLVLKGVATQLQVGDAIVLVDKERVSNANSTRWAFRIVETVRVLPDKDLTEITWNDGLQASLPSGEPAEEFVKVYALRQRAALFGHNAPDPGLLNRTGMDANRFDVNPLRWKNFTLRDKSIDLDAVYPKVVAGSWIVLANSAFAISPEGGRRRLYGAKSVSQLTRIDFALNSKVSRIEPDTFQDLDVDPNHFLRSTAVFVQSEALDLARIPLAIPVFGGTLALNGLAPELKPGQPIAISGKHPWIKFNDNASGLSLESAVGSPPVTLKPGDELKLIDAPAKFVGKAVVVLTPEQFTNELESPTPQKLKLHLVAKDGFDGFVTASSAVISLMPAGKDDPIIREVALIGSLPGAVASDLERTTLTLAQPLKHCYDRESVTVNANVARATHGETVHEILGSGDARTRDQRFVLKQPPLTYVSAETPAGAESTLELRVNDLRWKEVPTLFGRGPNDRVFISSLDDDGHTTVQMGDGSEGARLPTGQENVRALYRKGIGRGSNVRASQLTTLLTRPLGVKEAVNPEAAAGGDDRERLADARRNAPRTVLTLERVVSLQDYEDFARSFAGIAKALATWTWSDNRRTVFLTVAGPEGAAIAADSDTFKALLKALRQWGDPHVPIKIKSYVDIKFRLKASVKVAEEFLLQKVLSGVENCLRDSFSFASREFGQPVTVNEVIAVIHKAEGVIAVDVDELYRVEPAATPDWNVRLIASLPVQGSDGELIAAELLTLGVGAVTLASMP